MMLAASAAACDEKLSDFTGPTPNLTPNFSSIQREIFNNGDSSGRPACIQCHNAAQASVNGGLNLTEGVWYGNLVGRPAAFKPGAIRVIAGDPSNSYLIRKLEGGPDINGVRMPLNGPYLTPGQIAVIRQWIQDGALNN